MICSSRLGVMASLYADVSALWKIRTKVSYAEVMSMKKVKKKRADKWRQTFSNKHTASHKREPTLPSGWKYYLEQVSDVEVVVG